MVDFVRAVSRKWFPGLEPARLIVVGALILLPLGFGVLSQVSAMKETSRLNSEGVKVQGQVVEFVSGSTHGSNGGARTYPPQVVISFLPPLSGPTAASAIGTVKESFNLSSTISEFKEVYPIGSTVQLTILPADSGVNRLDTGSNMLESDSKLGGILVTVSVLVILLGFLSLKLRSKEKKCTMTPSVVV